jgi:hypothetical protein
MSYIRVVEHPDNNGSTAVVRMTVTARAVIALLIFISANVKHEAARDARRLCFVLYQERPRRVSRVASMLWLGMHCLRQPLRMLWERIHDVVPRCLYARPEMSLWFYVWVIIQ